MSSFDSKTIYADTDSIYTKGDIQMASHYHEITEKSHPNTMYGKMAHKVAGWQQLPDNILDMPVRQALEVMDDAITNGFEFRLQGSTILYREVQS